MSTAYTSTQIRKDQHGPLRLTLTRSGAAEPGRYVIKVQLGAHEFDIIHHAPAEEYALRYYNSVLSLFEEMEARGRARG